MSRSSDDDFEDREEDEDEMLERALEEQARREILTYARPWDRPPPVVSRSAAGPPVRNPPPVPPAPSRPPPPSRPTHRLSRNGHQTDADEESEVELLSISSEDDEPVSRKPSSSRHAGLAIDPDTCDDEEPDCWKRVDENELVRMVREMRETKLSTANLRRAPTYNRKTSVISEAYPRGDDFIDPLGHGFVDMRSLTLLKDSPSSVKDKSTETAGVSATEDPALREKIIYHSEKFDPKVFLSRIHQDTGYEDLSAGQQSLKMDLQQRKQQLKSLVKENFDCFVSCKNTIDDIHMKLQQIETDTEGAGTVHLSTSISQVNQLANGAFGPLFERQAQVERIRSVQGMLQRFRTLFNLPSTIQGHISKGDYDLAVREYKKAKSLVLPTHVRVLERVLETVEKVISDFKDKMYKSMEDPNVEFSQLESIMQLLLELEPSSDPVWHYLKIQNVRIRSLLEACLVEHDERMEELHKHLWARAQLDARWKKIQQETNKASNVNVFSLFGGAKNELDVSVEESMAEQSDILLNRLIHRLTSVLSQQVPPFWRLSISIFNGKFTKVSQGEFPSAAGFEVFAGSEVNATFKGHPISEVVAMITDIANLYESKVLNSVSAFSESEMLGQHMRNVVSMVSKASIALESKDAAPPEAVQVLFTLKLQIAQQSITRLCSSMKSMSTKIEEEDWVPVSAIEHDSDFTISALPLQFKDGFTSRMDEVKEMLQVLKSVTLDVHDLGSQINEIQAAVKLTAFECFSSLKDNLDKLALSVFQHCQELENKALNGGDIEKEGHFTGLQAGIAVANPHQRLLMVLSNTGYCRTGLVPVLLQKYKNIWVGDDSDSITVEKLMEAFSSLEESILGQYAQSKATLIGTAAAAFFLEDGLQWGAAPAVKGVRDAVVELLYPLIVVHAELTAGAKPYLRRAIPILIESLIDALVNVFNGSRQKALRVLDLNGFSQLALELGYLEGVLQTHFTAAALDAFSSLRNQLKEKALETIKEAEMLGRKKSGTRGGMEDASAAEERLQNLSVSTDELDALEQQVCSDFLQVELKRTKLIYMCFTNMSERSPQSSSRHSSGRPIGAGNATVGLRAPSGLQHQRFRSSSSLSDSDSSRPSGIPPYQSPMSQSGYASSDVGSETGVYETKLRSSVSTDRHVNIQGSNRRQSSRRAMFGATDDDFR